MSSLFLRAPRLLVLLLLLIVAAGLAAAGALPRMEDPPVSDRIGVVITALPGATAERVESSVAQRIEDELDELPEIETIAASSRPGVSILTIELGDDVEEHDVAWARVRDALSDAEDALPPGASRPELEIRPPAAYTLLVAVRAVDDAVDPTLLGRLADELRTRLAQVPGTAEMDVVGEPREELLVEVDPDALSALGLTVEDVSRALGGADAKSGAGVLHAGASRRTVELDGQLDSVDRIADTLVRMGERGSALRVGDVATVSKGARQPDVERALVEGSRAVVVAARMAPGEQVDAWRERAAQVLEQFGSGLPPSIGLHVVFDQNTYASQRFSELLVNLLLTALIVVFVTLVFMGWRAALVIASALPATSLMVLAGMHVLGAPLHQFAIAGMIIALGLLIDNAITMVDETRHHMAEGLSPDGAVRRASRALAVPLAGSTFTTAVAFAPLLLVSGVAGEFVMGMAVSVILALGASLFLALTVLPVLTARFLRSETAEIRANWWNGGICNAPLAALHESVVGGLLRRPWLGVLLTAAIPLAGFALAGSLPARLFPRADRDQFYVELALPLDASIDRTSRAALEARRRMLALPEVRSVDWFVGLSAPKFYMNVIEKESNAANYAQAIVTVHDAGDVERVIHAVQVALDSALPEAQCIARQLDVGTPFDAHVELRVFGPDREKLGRLGRQARAILADVPGVVHARTTQTAGRPSVRLEVDEEDAARLGLVGRTVAAQLAHALEGRTDGTVIEGTEELPVRVRLRRGDDDPVDALGALSLGASQPGAGVPLGALARRRLHPEMARIARRDGMRVNTVQGFTRAGLLSEEVRAEFERRLQAADFHVPQGYSVAFAGEARKRDRAVSDLLAPTGVLLVLMAGALVLSLGSFRFAFLVLLDGVLALGISGAALWLAGIPIGFMAIVGGMGLFGVAINDAIVVLAALRDDPDARAAEPEAMRRVVLRSTRHIVTTSATTALGFLPLVLLSGAFWLPLAVSITGGVVGATVLALYLVPAAYRLLVRRPPERDDRDFLTRAVTAPLPPMTFTRGGIRIGI